MPDETYALEPDPQPEPRPPEVVRGSYACRGCGYDIKGLAVEAVCPECGTPVGRSLLGDLLLHSAPAYLRRLWLGAVLIESAVAVLCAIPIGALLVGAFLAIAPMGSMWMVFRWIGLGMLAAAVLLAGAGWWMVTSPEPGGNPKAGQRMRITARAAAVAVVVCWLFQWVIAGLPSIATVAPATFAKLLQASVLVLIAAAWVQAWTGMAWLGRLAARAPDRGLERDIGQIRMRALIAFVAGVVAAVSSQLRADPFLSTVAGLVSVVFALLFLIRATGAVDVFRVHIAGLRRQRAWADEAAANMTVPPLARSGR